MTALLAALIEVLLPQETAPPSGHARLPAGRTVLGDLSRYEDVAVQVLELIRQAPGGEASFLTASPESRRATVTAISALSPEFRRLLQMILADYCEEPRVLAAFGESAAPPQPAGRRLAEMDDATHAALERVRERGKLWRLC
jgi:hypothetical protein